MTRTQKRIAIAEACGYVAFFGSRWIRNDKLPAVHEDELPDYLNDLNAMHEAEKCLTDAQWAGYCDMIEEACKIDGWQITDTRDKRHALHASARQRADAFLKATNRWKP